MAYILVVDDDEDFAAAVKTVLSGDGHEVDVVFDTVSALSKMEDRRPDLLSLDVMFPENSHAGFDLVRAIRRQGERFRGMPVLMLTAITKKFPFGFSSSEIDEDWLPGNDFLEKPVDFDVLRARVTALLGDASRTAGAGT